MGVDSTSLQVYRHASIDLLLNGNKYEAGIVVVTPLTTEAILGLDLMRKYKVTIDLGKTEIKNIQGRHNNYSSAQQSPHVSVSVCLIDSVKLPLLSEICHGIFL